MACRYDQTVAFAGYTTTACSMRSRTVRGGDGAAVFRAVDHVVEEKGTTRARFAADLLDPVP